MKLFGPAAFAIISIVCSVAPSAAQEFLSNADRQRVEALLDRTLKGGRSNVGAFENLSSSATATVMPRPMISRATGEICDRCTDFCRDYNLTIELDGGLDTIVYSGRSCIVTPNANPSSGPWAAARPLALAERRSVIPAKTLSEAQTYLVKLKYLAADQSLPTSSIFVGLNEFRADAMLARPASYQITEEDLASLRSTASKLANSGNCQTPPGDYSACGRLN